MMLKFNICLSNIEQAAGSRKNAIFLYCMKNQEVDKEMVLAVCQACRLQQDILDSGNSGQQACDEWEHRGDMAKKMTLDLTGVVSPMDLLKCNACLTAMAPGDILEVILADAEVVENLTMIILRSNDEILYRQQAPDLICVGIRKGPRQYEHYPLQT